MITAAAASQFAQANIANDVSMKVVAKAKDIAEQQGAAVISLLESAAELSPPRAIEHGKGGRVDVLG